MHTLLRGGMATAPDEAAKDDDWFEKGKIKRKKHKMDMKNGVGHSIEMWTINTGGLQGTWRVINMIGDMEDDERPCILCIQESSCTDPQWLGIQRVMRTYGYRGFHTGGRQTGETHGFQWHRGVLTFIDERMKANWIGENSWEGGQWHAVVADSILIMNYYVVPRIDCITKQIAQLQDFMEQTQWRHKWVLTGDFNEVFIGSWASTFASIYGGWQVEHDCESTRWSSSRVIDYFITNFDVPPMQLREEKLSDHKIVTCKFDHHYKLDAEQWRFKQKTIFTQPRWLGEERWHELFQMAYIMGHEEQWKESCKMVEELVDWDQYDEDDGQKAVDYEWCFTCARLTWSFIAAFRMALLEIEEGYDDENEMRRVLQIINHPKIKGFDCSIIRRNFAGQPQKKNQKARRRQVRIGRLYELRRRLQKENFDKETQNIVKKLFGDTDMRQLKVEDIESELESQEQLQKMEEEQEKFNALNKWKKDMKHNIKKKSSWINKKGSKLSPSIETDEGITSTKMQAAEALYLYWEKLWHQQRWNEDEKPRKIVKMVQLLRNGFDCGKIEDGRPPLQSFRERLRSISGCAGADGWTAEELSVIAASEEASGELWNTMGRWEIFEKVPHSLNNCKLVHIPKRECRVLLPGQFRPIAILSSMWRAWSSTWMRSKWVNGWSTKLFPKSVTGGMPGAQGPEIKASMIAHELGIKKFGITLDFKHAFDTIDVGVMQLVFQELLPRSCSRWHSLLFEQWRSMKRWVVIDSGVFPQHLRVEQGLPQGDPSSCVVMATMMLALKKMVDMDVSEHGSMVYQAIYMDDRTAIARSEEKILEVQRSWHRHATDYHLIENPEKAQIVKMNESGSAFEVLGTTIGNYEEKLQEGARLTKRVKTIGSLYRKIGIMPTGVNDKVKDIGTYGRARLAYGWISTRPEKGWVHQQEQDMWKAIGKLTYANPHMRRTIAGANSSLRMVAFMRQLRLISQRNGKLEEQGREVTPCQLDELVASTLHELQWRLVDGKFVHDLYREGFELQQLQDDAYWKKIGHYVRESYRLLHYDLYGSSGRHELSGHVFPPYDAKRRELACKWAQNDGLAWMLIQGAVQSPEVRLRSSHIQSRCVECGSCNPTWDHLWKCFTGEEAPDDFLLRRHLWPREAKDLALCQAFLDGMRRFNDGQ